MQKRIPAVSLSVKDIAEKLQADVVGDCSNLITSVSSLDEPEPHSICFTKDNNYRTVNKHLKDKKIACLLASKELESSLVLEVVSSIIMVAEPYKALLSLIPLFYENKVGDGVPSGIHSSAVISASARIGKNVSIGAFCSIGSDVEIGDNVVLLSSVTVYANCSIGSNTFVHSGSIIRERCVVGASCVLHNNVVVGADGFGFVAGRNGLEKVPQLGRVIIKDKVEVGANTCIDRGTFGDTVIGTGTKIDNLVQIGHNNKIGDHVVICGQVGIAGSCIIGDGCIIAGGVGIADHIRLVPGVRVGAQAGVASDLLEAGDYAGWPAVPASDWRRYTVQQRRTLRSTKKAGKSS